ncbi:MAG: CRISPR-associated endonuclease Cas1 [Bacteroidota bacterium]|nr:CRISPR-associated endonuclease Cas1 [Bacteroidota bacterium]
MHERKKTIQKSYSFNELQEKNIQETRNVIMRLEAHWPMNTGKPLPKPLAENTILQQEPGGPASYPFNAALNYWYGMLYSKVEGALISTGLDPCGCRIRRIH